MVELFHDVRLAPVLAALAVLLCAGAAEWLHARRVRRLAPLAFGPSTRPSSWARAAPVLRLLAFGALAWGFTTLILVEPKRYVIGETDTRFANDPRHILLVLDVSPSMRLVDAGPTKAQSRMQRARDLMDSFFERIPLEQYRVSVVAVYNGAKPVVVDTKDFEVVRNILGDLPMHFAFPAGKTRLFDGLEEAARMAKPWSPRSTTLIVLSDGDTVPAEGMPHMPPSVRSTLIIGVGDPLTGKFIDGAQSRQDVPTLRQIAARLGGAFHNGNDKQVSTSLVAETAGFDEEEIFERLTRREYALIACVLGALALAALPLLLHFFGTSWTPGKKSSSKARAGAEAPGRRLAGVG